MPAKAFLDTNIFVYAANGQPRAKAKIAEELIEHALASGSGLVSFQVAREFINAVTKSARKPMPLDLVRRWLAASLTPLCEVWPTADLLESALGVKERYGFHFYDSLIVASALAANCDVLLTEDLQHGQRIGELRIEDPFR